MAAMMGAAAASSDGRRDEGGAAALSEGADPVPRFGMRADNVDRAILLTYAQMLLDHVERLSQEENDRQTKVMAERGLY